MRFTIEQTELKSALATVKRGLPAKVTAALPILNNIRIVAAEGRVSLTATPCALFVSARRFAAVEADGTILVSGKTLIAVVDRFQRGPVTLAADDTILTLTQGALSLPIPLYNGDDPFPAVIDAQAGELVTAAPANDLSAALHAARAATDPAAHESLKSVVLLRFQPTLLVVVGSDGYRLHRLYINIDGGWRGDVLLPAFTVEALIRVLARSEAVVRIRVITSNDEVTGVVFDTPDFTVSSNTRPGKYFNYDILFPFPESLATTNLQRDALDNGLATIAALHGRAARAAKVNLSVNGHCALATSANGAASSLDLPVISKSGDASHNLLVGQFRDALTLPGDELTINLYPSDTTSQPAVVVSNNNGDIAVLLSTR